MTPAEILQYPEPKPPSAQPARDVIRHLALLLLDPAPFTSETLQNKSSPI